MSKTPPPTSPTTGEEASTTTPDREPAKVTVTPDGDPAGVAIYLTADDLRALGIIPDGVEAVVPTIKNGVLLIDPVR